MWRTQSCPTTEAPTTEAPTTEPVVTENNDIIVFEYNNEIQKGQLGINNKELLIKRIIVCPGQTFKYVGKELYVPHDREELEEGEFYYEDIIGLDCYNSKGELIGPIIDLQEVPQGLILEIEGKEKTILIPFVDEFVKEIDLENNKLFIEEIEGLLW